MDVVESGVKGRYRWSIHQDVTSDSPREWDNLGVMVCDHPRYALGDQKHDFDVDDIKAGIFPEGAVVLPLYLYDHSGITMSTSNAAYPFCDRWDSGQVGVIIATRETILREYGVTRITKAVRAKVEEVLRGEVETYDQYLTGQVYGYRIDDIDLDKQDVDSCWGFYGLDYCREQALEVIAWRRKCDRAEENRPLPPDTPEVCAAVDGYLEYAV